MADESNKDLVGARINLDTSKILPAFKVIDEGVRKNAEAFKALNAELTITEKNYSTLARAMDKTVLNADERRKKILDESNALVASRNAQAEYYNAKKSGLDQTNKLVDSKMQAQQAIVKKREDAIEQQVREHQQRLSNLQQKSAVSTEQANLVKAKIDREAVLLKNGQTKIEQQEKEHQQRMSVLQQRGALTSAQENLTQAKMDREFQVLRNGQTRMEQQTALHNARMSQLEARNVMNDSVLNRSSQYMLAGTMYYSIIQGTREAIQVIKDFEYSLVGLRRVMGDTADIELVKRSMIEDAKEYGYALRDVGDVYVQIAQQGFNEKETAALAKTAFMAANVEQSFRDAAQAQQLMTGAILNYGMAASDAERLLDRLNEVSNNFATDSNKLLQGLNRAGAAAKNAGVPINELIGYLTVLNQAGFTGSVAGNAIKSFISFSSRDIAIDKLEKYVGTIKQASGEMMPFSELLQRIAEKWYKVSDAERHEITQAVARGDQASRFIALMDNYDKVMKVATTAENSFGSAQRENTLTMSTLEKQSLQLKATWDALVISIGDSGLLGVLKAIVHEGKLLIDGFNSLPGPIKNTLTVVLSLGAAILVLNTGMKLLTGQSLKSLAVGLANASKAMFGLKTATDAANVSQKAFITTPIGSVLTVLSVVLGAATLAWSHYNGAQNEVVETTSQNERDTMALADKYKDLKAIVDDNTKSDKEIKQAKDELSEVIQKISGLMPGLISQWDEHGKAIDVNIGKLEEWKKKYADSIRIVENDNITKLTTRKAELEAELKLKKFAQTNFGKSDLSIFDSWMGNTVETYRNKYANEIIDMGKELAEVEQKLKNSQDTLALLDGTKTESASPDKQHGGKAKSDEELEDEYKERQKSFQERMAEFRHLTNMEEAGYKDAKGQLEKLQAIRKEFNDLEASDLYGIDEDIYKLQNGKKLSGSSGGSSKKAFNVALGDVDALRSLADKLISDAGYKIDLFAAKEFSLGDTFDVTGEKTRLYAERQIQLHEANLILEKSVDLLRAKQDSLNASYKAGKISADDFKKASEDVRNRIESTQQSMAKNSLDWWKDQKAIAEESFNYSANWIAYQKATREMSAQEEYDAWRRVQARYLEGTELRKRADQEVYRAKQALLQKEERALDDLGKKQKIKIDELKRAELDRIQEARDKYIAAKDEEIRAIDRLLQAEQQANDDDDYERQLAEKEARVKLLETAVGPEGIKERRDILKEIERMKEEHARLLRRRDLEGQKQAIEDEKREKEKVFDEERKEAEKHYNELTNAFDKFASDVETRAETLKQIQILKESEKNAEVLRQLDIFIAEYQSKMSSITSLSKSQAEVDFERYTENQRIWNDPNSTEEQRQRAHQENVAYRDKYGISQTDYLGLQHFKDGGRVKGPRGAAVPVVAHAGELYLNESQQGNLFRLLNFAMPQINYSMPSFAMASGSSQSVINHHYYTVEHNGDVNIDDQAAARGYWNERDSMVRRFESRGGGRER